MKCAWCSGDIWLNKPSGEWFHESTAERACTDLLGSRLARPATIPEPQQICPSPTCGLLIYDYRQEDNGDTLDLFCPHCDEHVAHLDFETLRQLTDHDRG